MDISTLLTRILEPTQTNTLYRFANADGKVWLMPERHMRTAMNLYQPSGRNGKLLKAMFPILHEIPMVRKVLHAEKVGCNLNLRLRALLESVFGCKDIEFSLFCGTPCVHQKLTMQISKEDRILGYCKITENKEIALLFDREAEMLNRLHDNGMTGIPRCMFQGEWEEGVYLFVQSTTKTNSSKMQHRWTRLHEDFLERLKQASKTQLIFEQSDYYQTLCHLKEHIDWLPGQQAQAIVTKAIHEVMEAYRDKPCVFMAYHADFTPWNMFTERGKMFVFDWEYAQNSYPLMLDHYHFFTQVAIFERHWGAKDIADYMSKEAGKWINTKDYRLYLLDIISRFNMREKGNFRGDVARTMNIWISVLYGIRRLD